VLRSVLVCGALFVTLCGCGSEGKVAPVSGVVTLNGKPTAGIAVTFQPIVSEGKNVTGLTAVGVTGSDGRYTVKLVGTETRGATVGKNQVRFTGHVEYADNSEETLNKTKPKVNIPLRYWNDPKFEFEVPAKGTSSADFQLTSP
jgi:hypothetical protein